MCPMHSGHRARAIRPLRNYNAILTQLQLLSRATQRGSEICMEMMPLVKNNHSTLLLLLLLLLYAGLGHVVCVVRFVTLWVRLRACMRHSLCHQGVFQPWRRKRVLASQKVTFASRRPGSRWRRHSQCHCAGQDGCVVPDGVRLVSRWVRRGLCQLGVLANSPQTWKRKRNFWHAVTVKSYVRVCVSRLQAKC